MERADVSSALFFYFKCDEIIKPGILPVVHTIAFTISV